MHRAAGREPNVRALFQKRKVRAANVYRAYYAWKRYVCILTTVQYLVLYSYCTVRLDERNYRAVPYTVYCTARSFIQRLGT